MPGPHTHAGRDTSQKRSIKFHGILKGEGQPNDIREVSGVEVYIPQPGVLAQRILRRHSR